MNDETRVEYLQPSINQLEEVRRGFCEHPCRGRGVHTCQGVITLTPDEVQLNCRLCGSGSISLVEIAEYFDTYERDRVAELKAFGSA